MSVQINKAPSNQGNILMMILIAIALMGALTVVVSGGLSGVKNVSDEDIAAKANKILSYAASVKEAVDLIYVDGGISESALRFAHINAEADYGTDVTVTPNAQIFNASGGGANYMWPIAPDINDGSKWEFYGHTRAPSVGDDAVPDLMMVLPNVTLAFCQAVNKTLGYDADALPPFDGGDAISIHSIMHRWNGTFETGSNINDMDDSDFIITPALYGCVRPASTTNIYHFYYTLLAR